MRDAREPIDVSDEHSSDGELHRLDDPVRIGRYRLCYELGAGGMATIYLARVEGPAGFAKPVAIKRIHPHLARRKDLVEMFLDEARIASLISHPNVCSTFDFGEVDGVYYLAMEYLVGESLSVLLRRVAKRPEILESTRWQRVCAKIIADVGEGLHAAHELKDERGRSLHVVHRDVSPQNVFVTYDGVAKVVDFGVAFANDRITQTVTGGIKGKLGYLAPEQLARQPYDRRLDVWALGIVLWECLTGRRLFLSRSEVDTLLAVQQRPIVPPSQVMPGIAKELDAIALHALSRDVDGRYPTARAMSRELVGYLGGSGEPITNVEVADLILELCGDRRDVRAEVVASVLEDRPATMTFSADTPPGLHDSDTHIRAGTPAAPSSPPTAVSPPSPAAPAPVSSHEPSARGDAVAVAQSAAGVARLAVIAIAVVAVLAMVVVAAFVTGPREEPVALPAVPPPAAVATSPPTIPPAPIPVVAAPVVTAPAIVPPSAIVPAPAPPDPTPVSPEPPAEADEAAAAPREPADRRPGAVTVTSPVSVEVCFRRDCHWTPFVFRSVPAGRATFSFHGRDGSEWTRTVSVPSGGSARLVGTPP